MELTSTTGAPEDRPVKFSVEKWRVLSLQQAADIDLSAMAATERFAFVFFGPFQVSPVPRNVGANRLVVFEDSPVYDGVARLGYKVKKNGGFQ